MSCSRPQVEANKNSSEGQERDGDDYKSLPRQPSLIRLKGIRGFEQDVNEQVTESELRTPPEAGSQQFVYF